MTIQKVLSPIEDEYKTETQNTRITRRKEKLHQKLWEKNNLCQYQRWHPHERCAKEVNEEDIEKKTEDRRLPDLTKLHKHKPKGCLRKDVGYAKTWIILKRNSLTYDIFIVID